MTKHTPGPWHYWNTGYGSSVIESPSHKTLAAIYSEDDARLMHAAPDLLNALSVLADAAESRGIPADAARVAIAKAVGHD